MPPCTYWLDPRQGKDVSSVGITLVTSYIDIYVNRLRSLNAGLLSSFLAGHFLFRRITLPDAVRTSPRRGTKALTRTARCRGRFHTDYWNRGGDGGDYGGVFCSFEL